jgi:hypothetical protein
MRSFRASSPDWFALFTCLMCAISSVSTLLSVRDEGYGVDVAWLLAAASWGGLMGALLIPWKFASIGLALGGTFSFVLAVIYAHADRGQASALIIFAPMATVAGLSMIFPRRRV